jgi:hypothetical protein
MPIKLKHLLLFGLVILAIVWLPTFTPEDIPTTIFLISVLGFPLWLIVSIFILILLWIFGGFKILRRLI